MVEWSSLGRNIRLGVSRQTLCSLSVNQDNSLAVGNQRAMEFSKAQNLMGCCKTKIIFDLLLKNGGLMLSISRELLTC